MEAPTPSATPLPTVPCHGTLLVEGKWTGDARLWQAGASYWEDLPIPLRWAPEDYGQHQGAMHVGQIETITRNGADIEFTGTVFSSQAAEYLATVGKAGISVDPDSIESTIEVPAELMQDIVPDTQVSLPPELERVSKGRIRAATIVDIPAFIDAYVELDASPESVTAAALTTEPTHAGVVLQAEDTGRVLMLQRAAEESDDPNGGLWEFPGGSVDPQDADPQAAAEREFAEECGVALPPQAEMCCQVDRPGPTALYRAFRYTVPSEGDFEMDGPREVQNPDGDYFEAKAWWEPEHVLNGGDHIRDEVPGTLVALIEEDPSMTAAMPPEPPEGPEETPDPSALTDADKAFLQALLAEYAKEQALYEDYLKSADPASPVAQMAAEELADLSEDTAEIHMLLGDQPPVPAQVEASDTLIASAAPVAPPKEWFDQFDLEGPTPLTITADGRVFGHLATWDSCHRSQEFSNTCVKPPSDPTPEFFHLGEVETAEGEMLPVGTLTVGGGHAARNKSLYAAIEHYDNVATQAAVVQAHEDKWGIGVFGALVPDASPAQVAALRRSPLSADWRKERGRYRLVAAHAVNTPGYPVPRGLVASVKRPSFIVTGRVEREHVQDNSGLRAVADRLARSVGLDRETLVASYAARVLGDGAGLTASLAGDVNLPIADYETAWDGGAAPGNIFKLYTDDTGKVDTASVAKGFLWQDPSADPTTQAAYKLPFADVINGQLQIVPKGVQACAGGRGVGAVSGLSADDRSAIEGRICSLYGQIQGKFPQAPDCPFG